VVTGGKQRIVWHWHGRFVAEGRPCFYHGVAAKANSTLQLNRLAKNVTGVSGWTFSNLGDSRSFVRHGEAAERPNQCPVPPNAGVIGLLPFRIQLLKTTLIRYLKSNVKGSAVHCTKGASIVSERWLLIILNAFDQWIQKGLRGLVFYSADQGCCYDHSGAFSWDSRSEAPQDSCQCYQSRVR